MLETELHFVSAIAIFLAAAVPIYLTIKLKNNNNLRKLTLILTIFILTHAIFHVTGFFGFDFLAEGVFEPLSVVVLVFFGIAYSGLTKAVNTSMRNLIVVWNLAAILLVMNTVTIILLLVAFGIFVWLAARSRNIRSFRFQISIFIVIWVLGEIAGILQDNGIIILSTLQREIGLEIHVVSMVFFSMMLWIRFYYSERSGKKMLIEDLDAASTSSSTLK